MKIDTLLDRFLLDEIVRRGLSPSHEEGARLIEDGHVVVNDFVVRDVAARVCRKSDITLIEPISRDPAGMVTGYGFAFPESGPMDVDAVHNLDPDQRFTISRRQMELILLLLREMLTADRLRRLRETLGPDLFLLEAASALLQLPQLQKAAREYRRRFSGASRNNRPSESMCHPSRTEPSVREGKPDKSLTTPLCGLDANTIGEAGDGVMSSPAATDMADDFDAALAQRDCEKVEIVTGQSGVSGFMHGIRPPTLADALNTHAMVRRLFANARRLNPKIKALRRGATDGSTGSKARQKGQSRG